MSQREGVVNMREVPEETWEQGRFGRREQDLGRAAGSPTLGLRREVIPPPSSPSRAMRTWPRRRSSWWCGAGDVAAFPAGTGVAHAFVADSGEELEFLSIGERDDNDVGVYPDSGKLLVASVADENGERRDRIGRLQETDYFDGEL
jgi:hypothetical protein